MLKCHDCHGNFHGVPNSFGNHVTDVKKFLVTCSAKLLKNAQNFGHVTATAELIEMGEYTVLL